MTSTSPGFGNDIHTTDWSFVMRARLLAANGTDGNQVIIENQPTAAEVNAANTYELAQMDAWLTAINNDHSHRSAQQKVLADKPAGLTDGCFLSATDLVHQTLTDPATGQCATQFPVASNPRMVAGQGLAMTAAEVQPPAAELQQLPGHLHGGRAAGAPAGVPVRRVRLQPAGCRPAAADRAAG